ncbi:MAG: type III-B CRISPR module RAMP protein Cmr4 [Bacteroidetes bacterium]|nr:type III-B CRISPR module RAMP protein Cmr4 [Bacteroidota bacterium]
MSDQTILFIHALTGLHPGGGTALGVIDLPIQRERHTNWPIIPGSSLKGVLRNAFNRETGKDPDVSPEVLTLFGPPAGSAKDHAGALTLSDARILAFPVRSLSGVFAWVTCPAVLDRLSRDLAIIDGGSVPEIPELDRNNAHCAPASPLVAGDKMILEEFEFSVKDSGCALAEWIASQVTSDEPTKKRLRSHLAVLNDDDFTHFVSTATEVVARIGLDYRLKTARNSALFYEEYLPPETLLYSLVICQGSYRDDYRANGRELLEKLQSILLPYVQIGGGETVGKGICAIRFTNPS